MIGDGWSDVGALIDGVVTVDGEPLEEGEEVEVVIRGRWVPNKLEHTYSPNLVSGFVQVDGSTFPQPVGAWTKIRRVK